MTSRSIRSRLSSSGGDKNLTELFTAGCRWEGIRASWFAQSGNWKASEDCLAHQRLFERELMTLWKEKG